MKISVVTIVYNDVAHIESTLLNVLGQSYRRSIEYIVIDGASTDGTMEIIRKYSEEIDIIVSEPDKGIYNAMNKGINLATGDYIIFINCGDRFSDDKVIESIINNIGTSHPDIVYGNYREFNDSGKETSVISCKKPSSIWYGPVASHQSTLYSMEYLRNHGLLYDEKYCIAADFKMSAQIIKSASSVLKTDICISDFDTNGISSINQNRGLKEANQVRREVFGWGEIKISLLSCLLIFARYLKKYCKPVYRLLRY